MQRCKVPLLTCLLAHPTLVGGVVSSQVEGLDRAPLTYLLVTRELLLLVDNQILTPSRKRK